jgi:hypothetical protein
VQYWGLVIGIWEIWISIDLPRQVCSGILVRVGMYSGPNGLYLNQRPRQRAISGSSGAGLGCGLVGLCYSKVGDIR